MKENNGYRNLPKYDRSNIWGDKMDISTEIGKSIQQAVKDTGQENSLGDKLIAWFNALSKGNESLEDRASFLSRLELLMTLIKVDVEKESNGGN